MAEGDRDFQEREPAFEARVAFIGDTHVPELLSSEMFLRECDRLSNNSQIDILAITGDGVDYKSATGQTIDDVVLGLQKVVNSGKPVVYLWANNEARIPANYRLKEKLQAAGVHVLENEDKACVVTLKNGARQAFVAAPRIISSEEHRQIMTIVDPVEQVLANRKILNGQLLERFKKALASTVIRSRDPNTRMPKVESLRTIILFHAPENLRMYDDYVQYAEDPQIQESELYREAIEQHQDTYHNIVFGLFGHVEGGYKTFQIAGIPFITTCVSAIGEEFASIAA